MIKASLKKLIATFILNHEEGNAFSLGQAQGNGKKEKPHKLEKKK